MLKMRTLRSIIQMLPISSWVYLMLKISVALRLGV